MILVVGSVQVRPGRLAEALALSTAHVQRSRAQGGCIAHDVHQDVQDPQRLVFIEQWGTPQALWTHFRVPASQEFAQALTALAQEPPSLAVYDAAPMAAPGRSAR